MKALVDPDLCIGCDLCADLCPEVFEMGDDGKAHVKTDPVPSKFELDCKEAAEQCPVEAIQIEEQ
ncbi:MAG TPA: ferredoxin [Thermoguttaceae bacterium]